MTKTAAGYEQLQGHTVDADHRPIAALAISADDLPDLQWETDESESMRFVVVRVAEHDFVLESQDDAPAKQTTVYGREAGEPLDRLLAALGLGDERVWDRIDRIDRVDPATTSESDAESIAKFKQATAQVLEDFTRRQNALHTERKLAAVALELGDLTVRERQVLSLLREGLEIDEVAELLQISPRTVRRHRRSGIGDVTIASGGKGIRTKIASSSRSSRSKPSGSRSARSKSSRS